MSRRVKKSAQRSPHNKTGEAEADEGTSTNGTASSAVKISTDNAFENGGAGKIESLLANEYRARTDTDPAASAQGEIFKRAVESNGELIPAEQFDETGYLRLNPDVRSALENGQFESAYAHYIAYGHVEGREVPEAPREVRNFVPLLQIRCAIDALLVAPGGGLLIVGWVDDFTRPLSSIRITSSGWCVVVEAARFIRLRRMDVEKALDSRSQHSFGFFGFLHFGEGGHASEPLDVELCHEGGFSTMLQCTAAQVAEIDLRNTALAHLAGAAFFGNPAIEAMGYLGQGIGAALVNFNKAITRRLVDAPYVERFGPQKNASRGTIIVCLYGKPEFYFVQNCLFAGLPGIEDYEFVYVLNSPELAETLLREARSASQIYGLANTVCILSGNAGFGAANNAAARIARSDRLLFVNPDVFPRDRDWAKKHTDLLDAEQRDGTRLFGVPLYYDDGSLMHGGLYFEIDIGLSMASGAPVAQKICRVEHYGKGAPPGALQFARPRPVPGVTGAFLSIEREWFEQLGGFTEAFIFGHYEDADLCLKSIEKGVAPWIQDIRMWHLEGKGSIRQLAHDGGSMVNRWLFSATWMRTIESGLKGCAPAHGLFQAPAPPAFFEAHSAPVKSKPERRKRVFR